MKLQRFAAFGKWFWLDLAVSGFLPWLVYSWVEPRQGEVAALWWSAIPPAVMAVIELAWLRRIDAISALSLAGIALSLVVIGLGGDARMILVRESLLTGVTGLIGLSSAFWPRPAGYYLARAALGKGDAAREAAFEAQWQQVPAFGRSLSALTWAWSAGLVAEAAIRCAMAWWMRTTDFLLFSPFVQYGTFGVLMAWTFWYGARLRRQRERSVLA